MKSQALRTLADVTARRWLRDSQLYPLSRDVPEDARTDVRAARERARPLRMRQAAAIRSAISERDFFRAIEVMTANQFVSMGVLQLWFLEQAFPLMTTEERAGYLQFVWCRAKLNVSPSRALRLFRSAPLLQREVPKAWPRIVQVFRGGWGWGERPARRRIARGVSWSLDRTIASRFAWKLKHANRYIGAAHVARSRVLAYLHDDELREHEVIVDPKDVTGLVLEPLETIKETKWQESGRDLRESGRA